MIAVIFPVLKELDRLSLDALYLVFYNDGISIE